jgi:hypothetical protein
MKVNILNYIIQMVQQLYNGLIIELKKLNSGIMVKDIESGDRQ